MAVTSTRQAIGGFLGQMLPAVFKPYMGVAIKPPRMYDERQEWTNKMDFIMACVGYAVGLGNVWRFPYLCFKNGGGAFLIPYMIISITSGVPLFFLEIGLGQFLGQGCVTCWQICPIFKGIGYGIVVLCTWLNIYYIVVLAWSLYYLFASFSSVLPWSHCNNTWNSVDCVVSGTVLSSIKFCDEEEAKPDNYSSNSNNGFTPRTSTISFSNYSQANCTIRGTDSVEEFWRNKVLQLTDGVEHLGGLNYEMTACLFGAWLLNYLIIWKGVKVSGKIVYFTAIFPYIMLLILMIRGATLEGASKGIEFYLKPNFSKLFEAEVWMDAGTQIFFSYAVSTGALIAMGSYNKFNNDCYRDSWIICVINSVTSFLAGFSIFSVLGFMAHQQGTDVQNVVKDGPGLAFIAYPKALAEMPWAPPFWSVMFFLMLVFLGIDSEFVGLEGLFTALLDIYPGLRHGYRPEITMGVACLLSFVFGLSMSAQGGLYVFQLFDYYSASGFVLLWFCFFECIAISWVYGAQRFYADVSMMIGYRISSWMLICWSFIAPITSLVIFFVSLAQHEPITIEDYEYPVWADACGWCLALSSMICIPIYFVYKLAISPGRTIKEKWIYATTPTYAHATVTAAATNTLADTNDERCLYAKNGTGKDGGVAAIVVTSDEENHFIDGQNELEEETIELAVSESFDGGSSQLCSPDPNSTDRILRV